MCNCFSGRRVRLALLERQTRTECQLVLLAPAIHQGTQERMGFIGPFRPTHGQRVLAQRMDGHPVIRIDIGTCRGQGHQGFPVLGRSIRVGSLALVEGGIPRLDHVQDLMVLPAAQTKAKCQQDHKSDTFHGRKIAARKQGRSYRTSCNKCVRTSEPVLNRTA